MLWVYLLNLISLSFLTLPAEPVDRWLVQVQTGNENCLVEWASARSSASIGIRKMPVDGWYAITSPSTLSAELKELPCILSVREDRKLEWRGTEPNDPSFHLQGDLDLIGMPEAWDVTTGGLTVRGDTIVVAIIDQGFQVNHTDLIPNIWHNLNEIPDDGVDNDSNGFTDDYEGFNFSNFSDTHAPSTHGTSVAGIIGARGNNNKGVAGINWRVKMMLLSGADVESELVEAYEYVRNMRVAYDNSNGSEGAFVVATNLSAGVEGEFGDDHPMWCSMYDRLGEVGILSAVAAPNEGHNVDIEGDMPTTCGSPYMIAVTNVDLSDDLLDNAGFGSVNIDIGAPGHGTITTAFDNTYKEFTGTSAATPHVAGTIALLYSTPCEFFLDGIENQPEKVAEKVRDLIFATGTPNNTLDEITTTGRRLQTDAAIEASNENCSPILPDALDILDIVPNPAYGDYVVVNFEVVGDTASAVFTLYKTDGMELANYPISAAELASGVMLIQTVGLPGGMYLLTLRNGGSKVTRKIFIP